MQITLSLNTPFHLCASINPLYLHLTMTSTYVWLTRCIPALTILAVFCLLFLSFLSSPYGRGESGKHNGSATIPQLILGIYTVFLHIQSIAFPARVCYAIGHVTKKIKESLRPADTSQQCNVQTIKRQTGHGAVTTPLFVIILPAYKEEMETLEETLRVLGSHAQATHCYHVRDPFAL